MKICLAMVAAVSCLHALGQGTVVFNTRPGTNGTTHVYGPSPGNPTLSLTGNASDDNPAGVGNPYADAGMTVIGASGTGGQYGAATTLAQLLGAPGLNQPESSLVPSSSAPSTFRTGTAAGAVKGGTSIFTNIPSDAPVATLEMVAWDNISGLYPTWEKASAAWQAGLIAAGRSPTFNLTNIGGTANVPPNLFPGVVSFNLYFTKIVPILGVGPPLTITPDTNGGYHIRFRGTPGSSYSLQRAPAITGPWGTGPSQTAPSSGQVDFWDLFPPADRAFYRTVQP